MAHEIIVTAPEAKFPSPLLELTGTGTWLVIKNKLDWGTIRSLLLFWFYY